MTRKVLPLTLMLIAGAVTALISFFKGFSLTTMLIALLAVFVAFYFIGCIIRMLLDSFDKKNEELRIKDEGEVIEKKPNPEETAESTENP